VPPMHGGRGGIQLVKSHGRGGIASASREGSEHVHD
jgi:hypothetical protein